MPFRSKKQRAYLYANEPEIAKSWAKKHGNKIVKKKAQTPVSYTHLTLPTNREV